MGGECCGCEVGGVVVVGDDEFGVVVLCSWCCVLWCGVKFCCVGGEVGGCVVEGVVVGFVFEYGDADECSHEDDAEDLF